MTKLYDALQAALKQKECNRFNRSSFAEKALIELGYNAKQVSLVTSLHDSLLTKNSQYILDIISDLN